MVKPTMFTPPPDDDDDQVLPEVTKAGLEAQARARAEKARREARERMTRRSWYTTSESANAFQQAVDDIHHATRIPKHEVVAALLAAAVTQAPKVEKTLRARLARVRPGR